MSTARLVTPDWRIVSFPGEVWVQHGWPCPSAPDGWTGATLTVGAVADKTRLSNPDAPRVSCAIFRSEELAEEEIWARIAAAKKKR